MIETLGKALVEMNERGLENDRALLRLSEALTEKIQSMETRMEQLTVFIRVLQNKSGSVEDRLKMLEREVDDLAVYVEAMRIHDKKEEKESK